MADKILITKKVGYVDTPIPKKCGTCEYLDKDTRRICGNKEVKADPQVPHDKSGMPIVNDQNGCCNEWTPAKERTLGARLISIG